MYVNELVKPVIACFRDQDSRVRYYSCEALYNIVKVTRGSMLPFFNEIFDALSKVSQDIIIYHSTIHVLLLHTCLQKHKKMHRKMRVAGWLFLVLFLINL